MWTVNLFVSSFLPYLLYAKRQESCEGLIPLMMRQVYSKSKVDIVACSYQFDSGRSCTGVIWKIERWRTNLNFNSTRHDLVFTSVRHS